MAENKVNFGLKNVHYAPITYNLQNEPEYGTPVKIPGAVELSLEPRGDMSEFYADDILYWSAGSNQGYDGTLTIANIPEQFAIDCLGETKDPDHTVMTEKVTSKGKNFALMFEFDGDKKQTRHILYNCSASRPTLGSSTKTNATEPFTNELTFVSMAREKDLAVKTKTVDGTPEHIYNSWFDKVYDGIKNTILPDKQKITSATQYNTKQDIVITSPVEIDVVKVTANGTDITKTTHWTFASDTKTLSLTDVYMRTIGVSTYNMVIKTNKGNDIAFVIERTA